PASGESLRASDGRKKTRCATTYDHHLPLVHPWATLPHRSTNVPAKSRKVRAFCWRSSKSAQQPPFGDIFANNAGLGLFSRRFPLLFRANGSGWAMREGLEPRETRMFSTEKRKPFLKNLNWANTIFPRRTNRDRLCRSLLFHQKSRVSRA